jgi:hypothetical protein
MATSGYADTKVTDYDTLRFQWEQESQSVANNTTTIKWYLKLIAGSAGKIESTAPKKWSVTVNGVKYSGTNYIGIGNNETKTLASGTETIAHDANGKKTFAFSFTQAIDINFAGNSVGSKSGSGTGTLNDIPRKSTLTVGDGTLGTSQTLTVSKLYSYNKHKILYSCGDISGYVVGGDSSYYNANETTSTHTWTPPISLAAQNTTGTTVSVKFEIQTYNPSNVYIGSNTYTKTYTIPASVKPSCTVAVSDVDGHTTTYGKPIKGISKLKITVTPTISQGSPIATYKVVANETTYTKAEVTTDVLKVAGTTTVSATVTDKRGRSGSASATVNVWDYSPPRITKLTVHRCNEAGTEDDQGAHIKVTYSGEFTSLNSKNTATVKVSYKQSGTSTYTTSPQTVSWTTVSEKKTVTDKTYTFSASTENSFDVKLTIEDIFNTVSNVTSASTAQTVIDFRADGKAVAFGKVAESGNDLADLVDFGFRIRTNGGLLQPFLESGSNLDDMRTPNTYSLTYASTYTNLPSGFSGTGVLEIQTVGASGQTRQIVTSCNKTNPARYERYYYQSAWGAWIEMHNDTGWIDLTLVEGISYGSEYGFLKGRYKNGVLYIKGDVKGVTSSYKMIASLPTTLRFITDEYRRFTGVYNVTYFCGFGLLHLSQLYVTANSSGAWDSTKNISIEAAICV